MSENKRTLYVALVKLLDIYSRYNPEEDEDYDLYKLEESFNITRSELRDIEKFVDNLYNLLVLYG